MCRKFAITFVAVVLVAMILVSCGGSKPSTASEFPQCPVGEFSGFGAGETESEALSMAHSDLAKQISLSIKVTTQYSVSQQNSNNKEYINTKYETEIREESALSNAQDARIIHKNREGNKISVIACMSRADAAKSFLEQQRIITDSLEIISGTALNERHPKLKNYAWNKTQTLWNKFMNIQNLLESWEIESKYFYSASKTYSKTRDSYKDYCQNAKLHWNPKQETHYSEIAFSKLSGNVKMEKSPCAVSGISLAYKGLEPECSVKFGLNSCSYAQSLSLVACDGTEYLQFKNDVVGAHQKPDFALEKLQDNFKSAEFWSEWAQEIKEWSPQCD
jgi:hypothetical protein